MKTNRTATITLEYPIETATGKKTELVMRRPTMQEHLDFPQTEDVAVEMKLYARLTGLDLEDICLLDMEDYEKLQKQFVTFRAPDTKGNKAAHADPRKNN